MRTLACCASWRRGVISAAVAAALAAPATASAAAVVVRFDAGTSPTAQRAAVHAAGGRVVRDLHVIRGLGVSVGRRGAGRLARAAGVLSVTPDARMRPSGRDAGRWAQWNPDALATSFVQSTRTEKAWTDSTTPATGAGVTVAVIDTGVAGDLGDFAGPDGRSRVIATAVTNPDATVAGDRYGHGTHVAGLVAGSSADGRYRGTAPEANLVSVKASDDDGNSSVIDVIAALQFVVDHRADYGIRVVNLSMSSSLALPYRLDPLDAAVEAAWLHGIVVVTAAGNRGTAADAVRYAPANDPYVLTVGAVDDHGTKGTDDDTLAPWSSRGVTQDGFAKPELVAPGAHIVAPLAPGSRFASLCPSCIVDGGYFRVGGTSMASPIVAGIAADVISAHPDWTPDQVKGALIHAPRETADGASEVAADSGVAVPAPQPANRGLTPSWFIDPRTGGIDYARAVWGRASWSTAVDALRASWSRASWSCNCAGLLDGVVDTTRASWSRASWSSFLGETPAEYGELKGGATGAVPDKGPVAPASAAPGQGSTPLAAAPAGPAVARAAAAAHAPASASAATTAKAKPGARGRHAKRTHRRTRRTRRADA